MFYYIYIYVSNNSYRADFGSFPPCAHILYIIVLHVGENIVQVITLYYLLPRYIYIYLHDTNIIHTESSVQCTRHTFEVSVFVGVCDTCPRGDRMNAMIRSGVNFSTFLGGLRRAVKRVCQSVSSLVE